MVSSHPHRRPKEPARPTLERVAILPRAGDTYNSHRAEYHQLHASLMSANLSSPQTEQQERTQDDEKTFVFYSKLADTPGVAWHKL